MTETGRGCKGERDTEAEKDDKQRDGQTELEGRTDEHVGKAMRWKQGDRRKKKKKQIQGFSKRTNDSCPCHGNPLIYL